MQRQTGLAGAPPLSPARSRTGPGVGHSHGGSPLAADSARSVGNGTGATLVVARPGVVQAAGTGRDKPVPYDARAGTVHEFDMGRNLFPARPRTGAPGWKLPWEVGVAGPEAAPAAKRQTGLGAIAYNSAHALALAALRLRGYRSETR